jgi:hypothetical protein
MLKIDIRSHQFVKVNIVSLENGIDKYRCLECGLEGVRRGFTELIEVKNDRQCRYRKEYEAGKNLKSAWVIILTPNVEVSFGLKVGGVYEIVPTPKGEKGQPWVNSPSRLEPTKLLDGEYRFVESIGLNAYNKSMEDGNGEKEKELSLPARDLLKSLVTKTGELGPTVVRKALEDMFQVDGTLDRVIRRLEQWGFIFTINQDGRQLIGLTPTGFSAIVKADWPGLSKDKEYRNAAIHLYEIEHKLGRDWKNIFDDPDPKNYFKEKKMATAEKVEKKGKAAPAGDKAKKKSQAELPKAGTKAEKRFVKSKTKCFFCRKEEHSDLDQDFLKQMLMPKDGGRPIFKGWVCKHHRDAMKKAGEALINIGDPNPFKKEKPKSEKVQAAAAKKKAKKEMADKAAEQAEAAIPKKPRSNKKKADPAADIVKS